MTKINTPHPNCKPTFCCWDAGKLGGFNHKLGHLSTAQADKMDVGGYKFSTCCGFVGGDDEEINACASIQSNVRRKTTKDHLAILHQWGECCWNRRCPHLYPGHNLLSAQSSRTTPVIFRPTSKLVLFSAAMRAFRVCLHAKCEKKNPRCCSFEHNVRLFGETNADVIIRTQR